MVLYRHFQQYFSYIVGISFNWLTLCVQIPLMAKNTRYN